MSDTRINIDGATSQAALRDACEDIIKLRDENLRLLRFVERVACYDDYTHDDVNEVAILHELQVEARKLLPAEF